jgi:hypothetical protein
LLIILAIVILFAFKLVTPKTIRPVH